MSEVTPAVGVRLRERRRTVGLSQRELSKRCDLSPAYVSRIEEGDRSPSYSALVELARHLGVTATWLLYGDGEHTCPFCTREGAGPWPTPEKLVAL